MGPIAHGANRAWGGGKWGGCVAMDACGDGWRAMAGGRAAAQRAAALRAAARRVVAWRVTARRAMATCGGRVEGTLA
eukprot:2000923-Prymnesium_polylepis.1